MNELLKALDLTREELITRCLIIDDTIEYYFNPKTADECKVNFLSAPMLAEAADLLIKARMINPDKTQKAERLLNTIALVKEDHQNEISAIATELLQEATREVLTSRHTIA